VGLIKARFQAGLKLAEKLCRMGGPLKPGFGLSGEQALYQGTASAVPKNG
jgi:hypothetical protein